MASNEHLRLWLLPGLAAALRIVGALVLIGVGLYLDHAHLSPGSMTWLGALLLVALAYPDALKSRRAWLAGELLPEVQVALQVQPLTARLGVAATAQAIEQAARLTSPPRALEEHTHADHD